MCYGRYECNFINDINNYSFLLFQPLDGFPVLHYVVSYNTSDNSTLIHTQVNSSMTSYTVSGVPGVTYYITVFAVNALGQGPINGYSIVNGEINTLSYDYHVIIMRSFIQFHCFPQSLQHNFQLIQ